MFDLDGEASNARDHLASLAVYRAQADPIHLSGEVGATIRMPKIGGWTDVPLSMPVRGDIPPGKPILGPVRLGAIFTGEVNFPTAVVTQDQRPMPKRDYWFQFAADQVATTAWGLEAGAHSRAQWNDVHRVERMLRVHYIDVGTGDAIWIQTPRRPDGTGAENILVDGGPDWDDPDTPEIENRALLYLRTMGLPEGSRIDYLVLTHPDAEHLNGLFDILDRYEVATIVDTGFPGRASHRAFVARAKKETVGGQPSTYIDQPAADSVKLTAPVMARILHSYRDNVPPDPRRIRAKNASLVFSLQYRTRSFLFTGDLKGIRRGKPDPAYGEKFLLDNAAPLLPATVLKIADHGTRDSSHEAFLRMVNPKAIVISSGRSTVDAWALRTAPERDMLNRANSTLPNATLLRTDVDDVAQRRTYRDDADGDDVLAIDDGKTLTLFQQRLNNSNTFEWQVVRKIQ